MPRAPRRDASILPSQSCLAARLPVAWSHCWTARDSIPVLSRFDSGVHRRFRVDEARFLALCGDGGGLRPEVAT